MAVKHTIRSSAEITKLFQIGEKLTRKNLMIISTKTSNQRDRTGRVAYIAGKRLSSAPKRNRSKRLLREAVLHEGGPWQEWDLLIIARQPILNAKLAEVQKDLHKALVCAGISAPPDAM